MPRIRLKTDFHHGLLGFQNDDLIYEVNGLPLTNAADLLDAADSLQSETSATVKLWRNNNTILRWYNVAGECVPVFSDPCERDEDCCAPAVGCHETWEICWFPF